MYYDGGNDYGALVSIERGGDLKPILYVGSQHIFSIGNEKVRIDNSGNVGIGTASPGAKLDVKPDATGTIGLIVQGLSGQMGSLQQWKDSSGNVKACIDEGGRLLFNNTDTKQSSGGPELISAQGSNEDNVVLWAGLTSDTNARFLFSYRGFLEWGPGSTGDQDIALYRYRPGGISIGNFFSTGSGSTSIGALRVNAPNPAGQALLNRFFGGAISPVGLLLGALTPTLIAVMAFRFR